MVTAAQRHRLVEQDGFWVSADQYQHHDGHQIRQHRELLRGDVQADALSVKLEDGDAAEQVCAE